MMSDCPGDQGLPADGGRLYICPRRRPCARRLGTCRPARYRSLQQDARNHRKNL